MLRTGKLCSGCTVKCVDEGTKNEPIEIECPECHSAGEVGECESCNNGWVRVEGCPRRYCSDMVTTVELIDLFREGIPPVAGGALDQTIWFLNATKQLRHDETVLKNL